MPINVVAEALPVPLQSTSRKSVLQVVTLLTYLGSDNSFVKCWLKSESHRSINRATQLEVLTLIGVWIDLWPRREDLIFRERQECVHSRFDQKNAVRDL